MMRWRSAPKAQDTLAMHKTAVIRNRMRSTFRKVPDTKCILSPNQLPVFRGIEIRSVEELEFLLHGQLPTRPRISGSPNELLATELFIDRLIERISVAVGVLLGQ